VVRRNSFLDTLEEACTIALGIAIYVCVSGYMDMLMNVSNMKRLEKLARQARQEQEEAKEVEQARQAQNQENSVSEEK